MMKRISLMNRKDILEYAAECGQQAAANILLLIGPDGFDGDIDDYNELYDMMNKES